MFAAIMHGLWPWELKVWIRCHQIRSSRKVVQVLSMSEPQIVHNIHTQDNEVQFAVTITAGTTEVEKENKDMSGGATESLRIRRDMSFPVQWCGWWGGLCGS